MTRLSAGVSVRGEEIGPDDHVGWFHRTFRQREPDGRWKKMSDTTRTRGRISRSDGTGKRNSHSIHNDTDLRLMAIVVLGLSKVPDVRGRPNFNAASQEAVKLLNGWGLLEHSFRALLDRAADKDDRLTKQESSMIAAYYRVYDFLRCVDRSSGPERAIAQETLRGHIAWLRSSSDMQIALRSESSLLLSGRHGKEDRACMAARHAPRDIDAEARLEEEVKGWP